MMAGLFGWLFGKGDKASDKSGKMAKDRLQLVLVQDRINMPSDQMQQMQQEIIEVISKYVNVDMDNVDFALQNRERNGVLLAEIPFRPPNEIMAETKPSTDGTTPTSTAAEAAPPAEATPLNDPARHATAEPEQVNADRDNEEDGEQAVEARKTPGAATSAPTADKANAEPTEEAGEAGEAEEDEEADFETRPSASHASNAGSTDNTPDSNDSDTGDSSDD